MRKFAFAALLPLLLPAAALAQGSDSCATAQPIAGTGMFPFDNTTATTDGMADPLCLAFGNDQVETDVWFDWTPTTTSVYSFETCGLTGVDTKIAAYDGGCGAPILACNDDSCGLQSAVQFIANAGSSYTLRVGVFPGASGGTGMFAMTDVGFPQIIDTQVNPANGHTYHMLEPSTWTIAQATAQQLGGNLVTVNDQAENDWINATFRTFGGVNRSLWTGYNDEAVEGTWVWVSGQTPGYENWSTGEPNGGNTENFAHFRSDWGDGSWNDLVDDPSNGFYSEVHGIVELDGGQFPAYCFGDGSGGTCPCGNAGGAGEGCANSSGAGATLTGSGSSSVATDDLAFDCVNLIPFQPALLFVGENALNGGNGVPFGDGLRCAGLNVIRLGVVTPTPAGTGAWGPGLGAIAGWSGGDTRYFQGWYRDPAGSPCGNGFNLSNGVEVAFTP